MTELVLAVETSTDVASVAIVRGGTVVAEQQTKAAERHDVVLLPRIDAVLKDAGVTLQQTRLLAVGLGPGAFGGLRVGLSTIKGLALATGVPVVGVGSLRTLAAAASPEARWVLPLLDAHRGELYAALYEREGGELVERLAPFSATPEELVTRVQRSCGAGQPVAIGHDQHQHGAALHALWPTLDVRAVSGATFPMARHAAVLAQAQLRSRGADSLTALVPVYIRDTDAQLPAHPLRLGTD